MNDALISPSCALASLCQHMTDDDAIAWMNAHMRRDGELAGYVLASELHDAEVTV